MTYSAAIDGLMSLAGELHTAPGEPRRKFELANMRTLMAALGDPQMNFQSVLVAGTNGKGSTAATLASILREAGYVTGLYTSPHLERVNERIQFSGEPMSDDGFAELYFRVDDVARGLVSKGSLAAMPSFFETMTAIAFLAFAQLPVDIAVLEVGMGGRLDATNIVEPLLSVITDISLDHTEWLGPAIRDIAREKAGILRPGGIMVTLPQHPEANQAIGEIAVALHVRGVDATGYIPPRGTGRPSFRNAYQLRILEEIVEIDSPLAGQHQQRNIALAIAAALQLNQGISNSYDYNSGLCSSFSYKISAEQIAAGVLRTRWPGRLELFSGGTDRADVLLDVAHNPAGAWALRSAISSLTESDASLSPRTLVFGCLRDKALEEMTQVLLPVFDRVIVTPVNSPRSASTDSMLRAAQKTGAPAAAAADVQTALRTALRETPASGLVVVSGSVYLVGEARSALTLR